MDEVSVPFRGSRSEILIIASYRAKQVVSVPFRGSRSEIGEVGKQAVNKASFRPLSGFTF